MSFVSIPFYGFAALTVLLYYVLPRKIQWCVLLIASYVFFWLNSEWLLLVLFGATAVTFFTGKAIFAVNSKSKEYLKNNSESLSTQERKEYKEKTKKKTKYILAGGIALVLGCLLLFLKYFNFFAGNVNSLLKSTGVQIQTLNLLLPLGVSFYTLQALAYMFDIYQGKYEPDRHFGKFMLFMSYFPKIVQGPIARHNQLAHQLYTEHKFDY